MNNTDTRRQEVAALLQDRDPSQLTGPKHAQLRQEILAAALGRPVSRAESGADQVRAALRRLSGG